MQIAIFSGAGTTLSDISSLRAALGRTNEVVALGAKQVNESDLSDFHVIVFPGGSGSAQADAIGVIGKQRLVSFVERGGGYLGICGGAFLATSHYSWSLGILRATVLTSPLGSSGNPKDGLWYRGLPATVLVELNTEGRKVFRAKQINRPFPVLFHNGPILSSISDQTRFDVLAEYRSEVWRTSEQKGTMVNSGAIVATRFGLGRVMAIGPHLEDDSANFWLLESAIEWLSGARD